MTNYPLISPVSPEVARPRWSVMIPTYNGKKYLEQTLRSVLQQAPDNDQMQIEVIDDCSTEESVEELVETVGQGRISFFRQPRNMGLIGNWNTCIERSRGHWVHILHQDDVVLPGFYQQLEAAMSSPAGAAFSRFLFMDEEGHWQNLERIERSTPGVLENWLEEIAVAQWIQFPAMVVKRSVYEKLGGFCLEAHYAADWEMWKRIVAHYPIWYEPQTLACYRVHSASETSRLLRSGKDIADIRKSIDISAAYLPPTQASKLCAQAKEHYAFYALSTARRMLFHNDWIGAIAQIREAWYCSPSFKFFWAALPLLKSISKRWVLHHTSRTIRQNKGSQSLIQP